MEPQLIRKNHLEILRLEQTNRRLMTAFASVRPDELEGRQGLELDRRWRRELRRVGLQSVMIGYRGFPAHISLSVNGVVAHGVPGARALQRGDMFTVDVAARGNGWIADSAWTYVMPGASGRASRLRQSAWELAVAAARAVRVDAPVTDVAAACGVIASTKNVTICEDFVGHGIGRELHEAPVIPFGSTEDFLTIPCFRTGLVVNVEPVITDGSGEIVENEDGFGFRTADGALSAVFELTVALTEGGPRVLNLGVSPADLPPEPPELNPFN